MTTTTAATEKQISYLLMLANRAFAADARELSQLRDKLGLSSFQVQRLSKADANCLIDKLLSKSAATPGQSPRRIVTTPRLRSGQAGGGQ